MKHLRLMLVAFGLIAGSVLHAGAIDQYEQFVLDRPDGLVTVRDLDLPPGFVRRVADRSIRADYRRNVWRSAVGPPSVAPDPPPVDPDAVSVPLDPADAERLEAWRQYETAVPRLRGFRASPFDSRVSWPIEPAADEYAAASFFVAQRLARHGLVRTVMDLMRAVELPWFGPDGLDETVLRAVGVPTDLLSFFIVDGEPLATVLGAWHRAGMPTDAIEPTVSNAEFRFLPTRPGFTVMPEDGSERVGALRLQIPGGRFMAGPGDGFALDVFRQLAVDPRVDLRVCTPRGTEPGLRAWLDAWSVPVADRPTLVPADLPVSPWAQDNGKSGLAPTASGAGVFTLVPRFVTINEQSSKFVPGDTLVLDAITKTGLADAAISPLLFQGGNLVPIVIPATGERILLVGEAEVHRNHALGLTPDQVLAAMRIEFGVDRCEMLPAASFHLDVEFTIRRCGDRLVACVNDDLAAARVIVETGLRSLASAGLVTGDERDRMVGQIETGNAMALAARIERVVRAERNERSTISYDFASAFATTPLQSSRANMQRFLAAMFVLLEDVVTTQDVQSLHITTRRYLESLTRRRQDRAEVRRRLGAMGIEVRPIPSLGDAQLGVCYVNGVHLDGVYLMPVYGDQYETLDDVAMTAAAEAFGPDVELVPIRTSGIQSLLGGVHCMTGLSPAVD